MYRAIDTRLGREVALKILPESFASDATRLRRFEQEIKVLSALNHSNILAMYDVGEASGVHYFVTELLDGRELRERLTVGGIPPRKAVEVAMNGTRVLTTELATNKHMIVEIDSQKEIELRGLGVHEDVIGWTEDGNWLVIWNQEMPARVWVLDPANGERRFVQTVDALANLGTMYAKMVTNTNGTVAVYRLRRGMYTLYLADGLK